MKLLQHILRGYTNIQLFCGSVFLRCIYANAVFPVDDLYVIKIKKIKFFVENKVFGHVSLGF